MAFLLSNILAACKIRPDLDSQRQIASPSSTTARSKMDAGREEAERLISATMRLHKELAAREHADLKPSEEINTLFEELVGMCTDTISETVTNQVLNDPRIVPILPSLHHLCSIAESHLESHWANKVLGDDSPNNDEKPRPSSQVESRLKEFPYYENYVALTRMELSALNSLLTPTTPPLRKFAFIGSGPLPLTSLCICQSAARIFSTTAVEVTNIDNSSSAISESRAMCEILGSFAQGMDFKCASADDPALDLRAFDVVYLAALVGSTQAVKEELLESVVGRMREGAYLVIRSAERLRRLLYAEFDPTSEKTLKGLEICLAVHPYNYIVNSVIIGRVKGKGAAAAASQ